MPHRVLHFEDAALAAVELSGTVRWPDVAALRGLYLHPSFEPGSAVLWDGAGIVSVDITPDDLPAAREAFAEVAEERDGGRTAFLVGPGGEEELWSLFPLLAPRARAGSRCSRTGARRPPSWAAMRCRRGARRQATTEPPS